MIKNRTAQLMFQTVYCSLGLVGIFASLGVFDDIRHLRWDFYVHFTNLSNFFCFGIMLAALIQTIRKKDDDYVRTAPILKFMGLVSILLTFLVFNLLLAGGAGRDIQLNWRVGSLTFHVILPVMYILHWFFFYERRQVKWYYPCTSILFPLAYFAFIFLQAVVLKFDTSILIPNTQTPLIYPYFFLNLEKLGIGGLLMWLGIILAVLVVIGYGFFGLDRLFGRKKSA